jgi:glycosyltransferase involved in cell wall biosynthesis
MKADISESVDVVIPVYNGQDYIHDSVFSALNQTFPVSQVIVVNDGSTDRTLEILNEISSSHPKLKVITKLHGERNAARNAGVQASQATYIGFLDADDIWLPVKIEKQVAVFRDRNDPELGLVYCDYIAVDLKNRELKNYSGFQLDRSVRGWVLPKLIDGNRICSSASGALVKRSCFDSVGFFDEKLSFSEDWEMWLRISEKYKVEFSPDKLVRIRRRPPGVEDSKMDFRFFIGDLKVISPYLDNKSVEILAWRAIQFQFQTKPSLRRLAKLFKLSITDQRLRDSIVKIFRRFVWFSWIFAHAIETSNFLFRRRHPSLMLDPKVHDPAKGPELTVLMRVCSGKKFLRTAIDSVFRQTFTNYELLIIDDGSDESLTAITSSYKDQRLTVVRDEKRGYAEALNFGIQKAKGKFVALLDASDFWTDDHLEWQIGVIRADPACAMVTSLTDVIDEGGGLLIQDDWIFSPEAYYFNLYFKNCIAHSSAVFRKEIIQGFGGYPLGDQSIDDLAFWKKIAQAGKIRQVPKRLASWRKSEGESLSAVKRVNKNAFESLLGQELEPTQIDAICSKSELEKVEPELVTAFAATFPRLCSDIVEKAPAFYRKSLLKRYVGEELIIQKLRLSLYGVKIKGLSLFANPYIWLKGYFQFLYRYAGMQSLKSVLKKEHF